MAASRSQTFVPPFNHDKERSQFDLDFSSFDDVSLTQMTHTQFQTTPFQRDGPIYTQQELHSSSAPRRPVVPAAPNRSSLNLFSTKNDENGSKSINSANGNYYTKQAKNGPWSVSGGNLNSIAQRSGDLFDSTSFDLPISQLVQSQASQGDNGNKQRMPLASQTHLERSLGRAATSFRGQPEQGGGSRGSQMNTQRSKACPTVGGIQLRSIDEIPRKFQTLFKFPYFNVLQSLMFDEVLYTENSVVASAPTGSGKTVIFELALIRLLTKAESLSPRGKVIYMAPMKALCSERFFDWSSKFGGLGLNCLEVTGDSEIEDLTELSTANLICTTPEKWDSMSRRWKDNRKLFQEIQLFLIDEIHILNDPSRGATVEAVVSRMKTLETAQDLDDTAHLRFVAVSATMPNYKDIAEWLGRPGKPASAFILGEKFRPVKLDRVVLGYPFKEGTSDFRFDMNLSYRLKSIIETHSHGKPTLVFCSSRKSVVQSAEALARDLRTNSILTHFSADILHTAAKSVHEHKLSELLHRGIGIHHAGLDTQDRKTVEDLFKASQLPVLISTSTLAMGVNLPAHLVVIKSTHFYNMGCVQEYSDMQLLQMIGRAGRPQFDTSATAVIMTKAQMKMKYTTLVNGSQLIESSLHKNLIEHLNAEIVLQTIGDMNLVVEWIRHTFLYVRALKNPQHYGLPSNLTTQEVEKKLQDLCLQSVTHLVKESLVFVNDEQHFIWPTDNGKLMARYCIAFETMKHFRQIGDNQESVADMIQLVSHCAEFDDVQLRINEKRILNSLNRDKNKETIRFALPGKIKTKQMKVNCLIQAQLSCLPVQDFSLSQDMAKIFRVGQRVTKCLMEFVYQGDSYSVLLHTILVYKGFKTKLWFDSRYVARQLDGIGPTMSLALANAGLCSFHKLEESHPRDIELIVNRHPPFGNQVKDALTSLPRYELAVEQMKCFKPSKSVLVVSVDLLNRSVLETVPSSQVSHQSILVLGDEDNKVVFKWRIFDASILRDGMLTRTVEVNRAAKGTKIRISLLSLDTVGLDIQTDYEPYYTEGWFQPKVEPSTSKGQTPASKLRTAMGVAKSKTPSTGQVTSSCSHRCVDKSSCGHKCCKPTGGSKQSAAVTKRMAAVSGAATSQTSAAVKTPKLEGPLYRESKDMRDVRSIMGKQQSGARLSLLKSNQRLRGFQFTPSAKMKAPARTGQQKKSSFVEEISDQADDSSDVIILDGDEFDDDFEDIYNDSMPDIHQGTGIEKNPQNSLTCFINEEKQVPQRPPPVRTLVPQRSCPQKYTNSDSLCVKKVGAQNSATDVSTARHSLQKSNNISTFLGPRDLPVKNHNQPQQPHRITSEITELNQRTSTGYLERAKNTGLSSHLTVRREVPNRAMGNAGIERQAHSNWRGTAPLQKSSESNESGTDMWEAVQPQRVETRREDNAGDADTTQSRSYSCDTGEPPVPGCGEDEQREDRALDICVNGWADLEMFQRSRQSLFSNGRPLHLQDDGWEKDELLDLTDSPRPAFPVAPLQHHQLRQQQQQEEQQQQQQQPSAGGVDCQWTSTTSSDEELCSLVDAATTKWSAQRSNFLMEREAETSTINISQTHRAATLSTDHSDTLVLSSHKATPLGTFQVDTGCKGYDQSINIGDSRGGRQEINEQGLRQYNEGNSSYDDLHHSIEQDASEIGQVLRLHQEGYSRYDNQNNVQGMSGATPDTSPTYPMMNFDGDPEWTISDQGYQKPPPRAVGFGKENIPTQMRDEVYCLHGRRNYGTNVGCGLENEMSYNRDARRGQNKADSDMNDVVVACGDGRRMIDKCHGCTKKSNECNSIAWSRPEQYRSYEYTRQAKEFVASGDGPRFANNSPEFTSATEECNTNSSVWSGTRQYREDDDQNGLLKLRKPAPVGYGPISAQQGAGLQTLNSTQTKEPVGYEMNGTGNAGDTTDVREKSTDGELRSFHRYGHVLAWNKTSGGRSSQPPPADSKFQAKPTKMPAFNFLNKGDVQARDESVSTSANLFDGIF